MKTFDPKQIADRLAAGGISSHGACDKGRLLAQAIDKLASLGDSVGEVPYCVFVPGRIEVLGKHTDYAGGRSLLATVERGFCIAAAPRKDDAIRVIDVTDGSQSDFRFAPDLVPTVGHWSNYPMTVARRVARNFGGNGPLRGANIVLASDLPPAAGMSSSSALMIGIFKALAHVNRLADHPEYGAHFDKPETLAAYLATIENGQSFGRLAGDRGVGTFGGSEDHTAILCCEPGQLRVYSFCPVRLERTLPLPAGYVLAIASSGVLAEKTGEAMAKYNRASRLVSALLDLWKTETGRDDRSLADAVRSSADAAERLRQLVRGRPRSDFDADSLTRRLEQFLGENERIIPAAVDALAAGATDEFGRLVDQSQNLAEKFLENQIPQTIHLARSARECGAVAASAFGAGFGGSVWALVKTEAAEPLLADWSRRYRDAFADDAARSCFFLSGAGPGLLELD